MIRTIILFSLFSLQAQPREISPQALRITKAFNDLRENTIDDLDSFYALNASFIDPIGSHNGLGKIKGYYKSLYKNVESIVFHFDHIISQENKHSLTWTMELKSKKLKTGKIMKLSGNSVIIFNDQNLVSYHRDYFDMSEFIYENLPLVGWIFKKFRRSFAQ